MKAIERIQLLAQRTFLLEQLEALPDRAGLTRLSLESRLQALDQELANSPADEREPAKARVTFRGPTVVGNYGIFADFATKAIGTFSDAIATVAASFSTPLAPMGPIPGRDNHQLLITSTALGSFGFELEEHSADQSPPALVDGDSLTAVALAMERTQKVLEDSAVGNDDQLAESALELDRRALDKIRAFVSILADNRTLCAFQTGRRTFRFPDLAHVNRSLNRLSIDNLREEEITITGVFQGALPGRRTFEFRTDGDVIFGKISPMVQDPEDINRHVEERATIRVLRATSGQGRPRYVLLEMPRFSAD